MFFQIEQVLEDNEKDLLEVVEEYAQTCLCHAEAIAYIIENDPEIQYDKAELEKIADWVF